MKTKRIIPCLDIKNGKTVKGVKFENIQDIGDPVEIGTYYAEMGADELVFLDITATNEKRKTLSELVPRLAKHIKVPFAIGGGISSIEDAEYILSCGASKVSINTAAVLNPQLIKDIADKFGSQRLVLALDTTLVDGKWVVLTHGGQKVTPIDAVEWAKEAVALGVGEILLTSMDHDGTKDGYAIEITRAIAEATNVPVVASGGAGKMEDFAEVLTEGKADAALAASVFHFREIEIPELKRYLAEKGIPVNR
ncbi:imidazole glycerol phosphate synthase subunit HisF [Paludibacter sp.]